MLVVAISAQPQNIHLVMPPKDCCINTQIPMYRCLENSPRQCSGYLWWCATVLHGPSFENRISLSVFAVSNFYRHCGFIDAHQQCWNIFRMFTTLLHHASCDGATVSYRLGVTVSCRLGATVSYLLGATLSYRLGAIGPRFWTIFVYPLTFLVGPKVFSGKTSLLNSVQWSGRAHVGQIPETKPYSYQTLLLATADFLNAF